MAGKLGTTLLTLWGLVTIVFFMIKAVPGDEAQIVAGEGAPPEQIEAVRERLGLNSTLAVQYLRYLGRLLHLDLGSSTATHRPVLSDISKVFPGTIQLVLLALLISIIVAFTAAAFAALRAQGPMDVVSRALVLLASGLPVFWVGLMLQYWLGSNLRILPISGELTTGVIVPLRTGMTLVDSALTGSLPVFMDALNHLVLPACVLAIPVTAQLFRVLRVEMLGVLAREHIAVARAKGLSARGVTTRHALPNALSPALTLVGVEIGLLMASAILVESVFGLSGLGSYLQRAVAQHDVNAVLGSVLFFGATVIVANLVIDVIQVARDPRIRAVQSNG
ncbi:ABC transporter permease [Microtetraspora malaysiensis]|uniref:ABC transporter permease n=1 Tax=Microtetraspora malaysiensis TaxID=161358 RepID=UPI00082D9070|nr:ABC transporter permease [Microtetraspora malaysiensis]